MGKWMRPRLRSGRQCEQTIARPVRANVEWRRHGYDFSFMLNAEFICNRWQSRMAGAAPHSGTHLQISTSPPDTTTLPPNSFSSLHAILPRLLTFLIGRVIDSSLNLHLAHAAATMQRVKKIDYEDDDLYSNDGEGEEEEGYTDDDRDNFATLTPVVRAELDEAGLQAADREIEEALWHYYWDVSKSVAYLKNTRTPRTGAGKEEKAKGAGKAKSKFELAAEKSAAVAGECGFCFAFGVEDGELEVEYRGVERRGGLFYPFKLLTLLTID